jgi:hypothetical protein
MTYYAYAVHLQDIDSIVAGLFDSPSGPALFAGVDIQSASKRSGFLHPFPQVFDP